MHGTNPLTSDGLWQPVTECLLYFAAVLQCYYAFSRARSARPCAPLTDTALSVCQPSFLAPKEQIASRLAVSCASTVDARPPAMAAEDDEPEDIGPTGDTPVEEQDEQQDEVLDARIEENKQNELKIPKAYNWPHRAQPLMFLSMLQDAARSRHAPA